MDVGCRRPGSRAGDVVVVGNRDDAQRLAIELGAALLVISNGATPGDDVLELARERGHRGRRLAAGQLRHAAA